MSRAPEVLNTQTHIAVAVITSFFADVVDHLPLADHKVHSIRMGGADAVILVVLRVVDGLRLKLGQVVPKPIDLPGREWRSLPLRNVGCREYSSDEGAERRR